MNLFKLLYWVKMGIDLHDFWLKVINKSNTKLLKKGSVIIQNKDIHKMMNNVNPGNITVNIENENFTELIEKLRKERGVKNDDKDKK